MLANASKGGVNPIVWHKEFISTHALAQAHKIPEVQGTLAAKAFLRAVGERMAPQWAQNRLDEIVTAEVLEREPLTLMQLSSIFLDLMNSPQTVYGAKNRSFATLRR